MPRQAPPHANGRSPIIWLLLIALIAVALRAGFNYSIVFTPAGVNFQENDSWYHMRAIDYMTANWPHRLTMDPYAGWEGQYVWLAPMFDLITSSVALVVGGGSPSERVVDTVAAWMPAILGAIVPLVIYAAARRVFDRPAALWGAALTALIPGHFLERSRLGYADHHALEALLSSIVLWLMIRALQQRPGREGYVAAIAAGTALGAYLLAWMSGSFLVAIICGWLIVQTVLDGIAGESQAWPARVAAVASVTALAIVALLQVRVFQFQFQIASLAVTAALAVAIELIRCALLRLRGSPRLLPLVLAALMSGAFAVAAAVMPSLVGAMLAEMRRVLPEPSGYMVTEAMPLWTYVTAPWVDRPLVVLFGTGLPLGVIALIPLTIGALRRPHPATVLVITWSVVVLAATVLRNRFGYYLVPMLGLLGGWLCARILARAGAGENAERRTQNEERTAGRRTGRRVQNAEQNAERGTEGAPQHPEQNPARRRRRRLVQLTIAAVALVPNLWPARDQVQINTGLNVAWMSALDWLRRATPEPFGRADFYFARYETAEMATRRPDYSVIAWWDYGYWITRAARRVPVANPTLRGAVLPAAFLVETDPARAAGLLDSVAGRFVVLDWELPFRFVPPPVNVMGKFESVVTWAGRPTSDYYEEVYVRDGTGALNAGVIFYPAYYRAMLNRLYHFQGRAVTPTSSAVMTFADRLLDGHRIREVTALRTFTSYEAAAAYLQQLGEGPHRIVGVKPDESPVPLEPVSGFERVWSSRQAGPWRGKPAIVIFSRSK